MVKGRSTAKGSETAISGQQLLRLVEDLGDGVFSADTDGRIRFVNPAGALLAGGGVEEVLGRHFLDLFQFASRANAEQAHRRILAGERVEDQVTMSSGAICHVKAGPLRDASGEVVGVFGIARDVTEQRRTEEAYRAVVESSLQALLILQGGSIVFANQATAGLLGYSVDELLAMSPRALSVAIHPEDHAMVWGRFGQRLNGEEVPPRYEFRMLRKDGGVIWVEMHATRMTYQGEVAIQAALVDVTGRKRRELEQRAVLGAVTALRASGDLAELLAQILDQVGELLDARGALVALREPSSGDAVLELARGKWASLTGDRIPAGEGATALVMNSRQTYVSHDVAADARFVRRDVLASTRVVLGAPLIAGDEPIGVLWVGRNADAGEDDVRVLSAFAEMIAVAVRRAALLDELQRSNAELARAYDSTLEGWSRALDLRDHETQGHTRRVALATVELARLLEVDDDALVHIRRGALLHDIGKMSIPDSILLKPGPLTDAEWAVMRQHTSHGHAMLSPVEFLEGALDIPYCHHEWWDGSGYPRGLKGDEIPFAARIFAVVDVWDALRSQRPYRAAWPAERILELIRRESGSHFDPQVVEAFLKLVPEWSGG